MYRFPVMNLGNLHCPTPIQQTLFMLCTAETAIPNSHKKLINEKLPFYNQRSCHPSIPFCACSIKMGLKVYFIQDTIIFTGDPISPVLL